MSDGLPAPTLPRSESLVPLQLQHRPFGSCFPALSHSGKKRSPTSGPPAALVLESRPGLAREFIFGCFLFLSFSQPVQMTRPKVQTVNRSQHHKLFLQKKIRGVTQKWRRFL